MINKKNCVLFMYFCEINKFLQSFLTNLCLGFKCSKFSTSCVNVSFRVGRGLMLYAAISACFDDVPPGTRYLGVRGARDGYDFHSV